MARVSFSIKVDAELNIRYQMLKQSGYLKKADINAQLEARLKELVTIHVAQMPMNEQRNLDALTLQAYNKRYNTKSALNDSMGETPTPTDSFGAIPEELPEVLQRGDE